jgi:hypothetical protein
MATPARPWPAKRPFAFLVGIAAATLAVLAYLLLFPRPTVVELALRVDRIAFTVLPAAAAPDPLAAASLLSPSLGVSGFEIRQADRVEAAFEAGQSRLRPGREGSILFTAPAPFQPRIIASGPIRVTVETSGRDRAGGERLAISLEPAADGEWTGHLPAGAELTATLRDTEVTRSEAAAHPEHIDQATRTILATASDPLLSGGPGESRIGLTLPPRLASATLLRVLDPATGEITAPRRLPLATAELRSLPWRDRLVLLEPDPGETAPHPLLRPGLRVRDPELFRMVKLEAESGLLGGQIRFPGGEQPPADLAPRSLALLAADTPMTLRSLAMADGHLEIVLWGQTASLRAGPAPDLLAEILPNRLAWLCSHRLSALIYTIVASVLGASLGLFRLLGFFKD